MCTAIAAGKGNETFIGAGPTQLVLTLLRFGSDWPSISSLLSTISASSPFARRPCAGPATAGLPWGYLEEAFAAGLLNAYDRVSVHPYRSTAPVRLVQLARRLHVRLVCTVGAVLPSRRPPSPTSRG